jgi:cytoskeletal protein RodZ
MKKNEKGFGVIEALLILVIVGLIGFVGWYVGQSKQKTNESSTTTYSEQKTEEASEESTYKEYKDDVRTFKFEYPKDWKSEVKNAPADSYDSQQKQRSVIAKSPDYAEDVNEIATEVTNGAVLTVSAANTTLSEPIKSSIENSEGFKETTVAGLKTYYYIMERSRSFTYAFVKDGVIYTIALRTIRDDKANEQKYLPVLEKAVSSFAF